jgi:WD repeat-containing protein 23
LIYSSINPFVRLLDLETLNSKSEKLNFSERGDGSWNNSNGIMSIKFSGDTREIVAGTKQAQVLVYDLISNKIVTKVAKAHDDEINSVCFANR